MTYRAATLAIQARRDAGLRSSVLIAGSMSPLEDCYAPHLTPTQAECEVEHDEMARYLAAAGVDLILVETMNTIREAVAAASAAQRTGLPFMVSLVWATTSVCSAVRPWPGAVAALAPLDPLGLLVNCMSSPAVLSPARVAGGDGIGRLAPMPTSVMHNRIGDGILPRYFSRGLRAPCARLAGDWRTNRRWLLWHHLAHRHPGRRDL
ncbi:homocysteine S-methyltransferase family protein [Candidatus Amarolinea dominans]|uniref:homocysteine S-methyltransferase family protein n=1 Tax=Candidatus Amarolinea dominans TaxID=3140696 RepID=UPI00313688A4|nr:homocysteine S-methyltransferase family protein [Anaerolineae bacterium]